MVVWVWPLLIIRTAIEPKRHSLSAPDKDNVTTLITGCAAHSLICFMAQMLVRCWRYEKNVAFKPVAFYRRIVERIAGPSIHRRIRRAP